MAAIFKIAKIPCTFSLQQIISMLLLFDFNGQTEFMMLIIGWTFVGMIVMTSLAVVLDLFGLLKLERGIRGKLQAALLLEVIAVGVGVFSGLMRLNPKPVATQIQNQTEKTIDEQKVQPLEEKVQQLQKAKVYLQIASGNQHDKAAQIKNQLAQAGYNVADGIENVGSKAPKATQVRYFTESDKTTAKAIADLLKANGVPDAEPVQINIKTAAGNFEVWFSPS